MPIPEWVFCIILFALLIFSLIILVIATINLSDVFMANNIQKKINKSLLNIFQTYIESQDYKNCLYELNLVMQKLVAKSSMLSKQFDSIIALLESFLVDINSEKVFCNNNDDFKESIIGFLNIYNSKKPLEQIKGSNYVILKELLDNNDKDKHTQIVKQLAIELKQKENTIYNLQYKNKKSEYLSKSGIFLTVVFGIIAILQSL